MNPNVDRIGRAVVASLTSDLLYQPWRARVERGEVNSLTGHCSVASEAIYFMLGGKKAGYTPVNVRHEGSSHWWIRGPHGEVIDLTAAQFTTPVPYEKGRGRGFATPGAGPSKRARIVIARAKKLLAQGAV